jgi:hypothetical protein
MRDKKRWIGPFTTLTPAGRTEVDVNRLVKSEKFQRTLDILRQKLVDSNGSRPLEHEDGIRE